MNAPNAATSSPAEHTRSEYARTLDQAWADATAPRAPNAPTVVSTFAGGGGSLTGYAMAGYKDLLAVEWDAHAVETLKANHPDVPIFHGDIAKLSVEQALELIQLQPGELDVLDGSPPCQGFSTSGKRMLDDPRNQLFTEFVRLLQGLQPKAFVMENVSGMVKGKMKLLFAEILTELKSSGYKVSARLLNSAYFGVPQTRQRLIFVGVRNDLNSEPSHPKAQTRPITVAQAIKGVNNKTYGIRSDTPAAQRITNIIPYIQQGKHAGHAQNRPTTGFNMWRLRLHKPSNTIPAMVSLGGIAAGLVHPTEHRFITIEEAKRLQSFPDEYQLSGKFEQQWARIGNSVPPLMMRAIAQHIRTNILERMSGMSLTPELVE